MLVKKIANNELWVGIWEKQHKKEYEKLNDGWYEVNNWVADCKDLIDPTIGTLSWDLDEMTLDVKGNLELTGKSKAAKLTMKGYVVVNNGAYIHVQKSQIKSNKNLGGGSMGMKIGAK